MKTQFSTTDVFKDIPVSWGLNGRRVYSQAPVSRELNRLMIGFGNDSEVGITSYVEALNSLRSNMYSFRDSESGAGRK